MSALRAVSVLEVADPAVWDELAARVALDPHVGEALGPTRRVVRPSFEKEILPKLAEQGAPVLVRWARRDPAAAEASAQQLEAVVAALPAEARRVLHAAQHHAESGLVLGMHAWDPLTDAPSVRALHGAGLIEELPDEAPIAPTIPYLGRYRLHPDLPPPPPIAYDFVDALMDETDDLEAPRPGPVGLLHDLASLAAAIEHTGPRRTHAGTIAKTDAKKLGTRLGVSLQSVEDDERWGRALRGLEALRVVSMDPLARELHLDLGLETTLSGDTADAVDHLVHRLLEADLHGVVPAVREALRQAGDGAVDELVFLELLRDQHRDVIFPAWHRDGALWYPLVEDRSRPYDDDGFTKVERPMVGALLGKLSRLGLVRRAPGVFAATADGRVWAGVRAIAAPPVWVSSDLEVLVPPDAITPWERYQLERLSRCLGRDVVDRYRLERKGLETWLSTHDLDEALEVLRRRCPALPATVEDTLASWARSAMRVVLTRGVLLPA